MKSEHNPIEFDLKKVLSKSRNDYQIANDAYLNVLVFRHKMKMYMFSFATLFFYEIEECVFLGSPNKGYKPIRRLNQYYPDKFCSYSFWYNTKKRETKIRTQKFGELTKLI